MIDSLFPTTCDDQMPSSRRTMGLAGGPPGCSSRSAVVRRKVARAQTYSEDNPISPSSLKRRKRARRIDTTLRHILFSSSLQEFFDMMCRLFVLRLDTIQHHRASSSEQLEYGKREPAPHSSLDLNYPVPCHFIPSSQQERSTAQAEKRKHHTQPLRQKHHLVPFAIDHCFPPDTNNHHHHHHHHRHPTNTKQQKGKEEKEEKNEEEKMEEEDEEDDDRDEGLRTGDDFFCGATPPITIKPCPPSHVHRI